MKLPEERLKSQIAALESKVDLLESEITHLDKILRKCGFPNGISTLKFTVEELIAERREERQKDYYGDIEL